MMFNASSHPSDFPGPLPFATFVHPPFPFSTEIRP
ncbi:hypothetical protein QF012_005834 [Pseudomonas laurylsulfatiphila]|jgi:hypothetical protein